MANDDKRSGRGGIPQPGTREPPARDQARAEPHTAARPSRDPAQQERPGRPADEPQPTSPPSFMQRMFEDIDRLFGGGFGLHGDIYPDGQDEARRARALPKPSRGERKAEKRAPFAPAIDVFHRGDRLVIVADLPGLEKKDVRVTLEGATIVIAGERTSRHEGKLVASERRQGTFRRRVPLPVGVDAKACDARMEDGLLEVTIALPRGERRDIAVQNGRLPKTNVFGGSSGPPSKPH